MKIFFHLLPLTTLLLCFDKPTDNYPFDKWDKAILEKANTAKIIKNVAKKYQREKKKIDNLFKHITQLVNKGRRELENNNLKEFGKLMIEDHFVLKELGVSTGRLDNLVNASIRAGSFGAKLSGAGGGDIMIALTSESNRKSVEKAIEEAGGEVIKVETGIEGVISHN